MLFVSGHGETRNKNDYGTLYIFIIVLVIHSNKTLQAHFILAYLNKQKCWEEKQKEKEKKNTFFFF